MKRLENRNAVYLNKVEAAEQPGKESIIQDNTVKKLYRSSEEILNKETRQCLPGFI